MNNQKSESQQAAQKRLDVAILQMDEWAVLVGSLADDLEAGAMTE